MTFALASQFHFYSLWGLTCESASRRFQPGEGPSRGLLRDCTTSMINRFAALAGTDSILGRCAVSAVPPCTAARVQCPQPDSANLTIVWLQQFAGPPLGGRCDYVELETKVAEDYTKFYNHGAFSWLKAPTCAFTIETLC